MNNSMRYIFLCGGTVSGLGKGVTISSLGVILKNSGYKITSIKIDPYIVLPLLLLISG